MSNLGNIFYSLPLSVAKGREGLDNRNINLNEVNDIIGGASDGGDKDPWKIIEKRFNAAGKTMKEHYDKLVLDLNNKNYVGVAKDIITLGTFSEMIGLSIEHYLFVKILKH